MRLAVQFTGLLLLVLTATLILSGCGGGSKSSKNQFGAPKLSVPESSGPGKVFVVPEDLIPAGATPSKTDSGVSDRIYVTTQRASEVKTFFEGALKGAQFETTREGEHISVTTKEWVIKIVGGGEGAETTIVYAKAAEVR